MKEMVGGCCVCSDERGWTENPLVYCDGQGCNVAVHQACYGIIQVPKGPWYCRKCESQERAARVKCELCPMKDGALKRTDSNSWCHVVCALFIPEAWFANVQTMEPIVLKDVPQERFNKVVICYICEEQGRESKAGTGACMQCNKNGCKQYFHVTCAQSQGLLCEEAGNYGDNVKYCGYCAYHCKKLKRDTNIKTIPAFKPIPSDTPDSSPEKSTLNKSDSEKKTPTSSDIKKVMQTPPTTGNTTDSSLLSPTEFTGFTTADIKDTPSKVEPKVEKDHSSSFSSSFDKTASPSVFPSHNSPDTEHSTGKRSRSRSQEKSENKKKIKKVKPAIVMNKRCSKDGMTSSTPNSSSRKHSVSSTTPSSVASSTVSSTSTHSNGQKSSKPSTITSSTLGSPNFTNSVFGGSPFFQSLSASGPISLSPFNQSEDHHETNLHNGPPKIFPSRHDSRQDDSTPENFPSSMEQLLEKQWEQGSQFLMEQGQHFDIASLLNCLYQLQNENHQLGEYIKNLTSRRDHLLAVNARLSLSFSNYPSSPDDGSRSRIPNGDIGDNESDSTNPSPLQQTPSPTDSASPRTSVESRLSVPIQDQTGPLFPANLSSPIATSSHGSVTMTTTVSVNSSSPSVSYNGVQPYKHKDKT